MSQKEANPSLSYPLITPRHKMVGKNCLQTILATPSVGERKSKSEVWEGEKRRAGEFRQRFKDKTSFFSLKKIAKVRGGGQTLDFLVFIYFLAAPLTTRLLRHLWTSISYMKKSIVLLLVKEPVLGHSIERWRKPSSTRLDSNPPPIDHRARTLP